MCDSEPTNPDSYPQPHPPPQPDLWVSLPGRLLPTREIEAYTPLYRIHQRQYPDPRYFSTDSGRNRTRFAAPGWRDGYAEYGVLYASLDYYGCFRETVARKTDYKIVEQRTLEQRQLSVICPVRDLILVDLTGSGLAWIGADSRLTSGDYDEICQPWSLAFWQYNRQIDGIFYPSRFDPTRYCVALYSDRVLNTDLNYHVIAGNLVEFPKLDRLFQEYRYEYEPEQPSHSEIDIS